MDALAQNKLLVGVSSLLVTLGSRHLIADLGMIHNHILASTLVKTLVVFAMFFLATRDVVLSIALGAACIVVYGMLHDKSQIIPAPVRDYVTTEQYQAAKRVVERYQATYTL